MSTSEPLPCAVHDVCPQAADCVHGCRAAADELTRLGQEMEKGMSIPRAEVVEENDGWSAYLPGLPVAADGSTREGALADLVQALREYAVDWRDHLRSAPNHHGHESLIRAVDASNDAEIFALLAPAADAGVSGGDP